MHAVCPCGGCGGGCDGGCDGGCADCVSGCVADCGCVSAYFFFFFLISIGAEASFIFTNKKIKYATGFATLELAKVLRHLLFTSKEIYFRQEMSRHKEVDRSLSMFRKRWTGTPSRLTASKNRYAIERKLRLSESIYNTPGAIDALPDKGKRLFHTIVRLRVQLSEAE